MQAWVKHDGPIRHDHLKQSDRLSRSIITHSNKLNLTNTDMKLFINNPARLVHFLWPWPALVAWIEPSKTIFSLDQCFINWRANSVAYDNTVVQYIRLITTCTFLAAFESDSTTRLSGVIWTQLKCLATITDCNETIKNLSSSQISFTRMAQPFSWYNVSVYVAL